MSEDFQSIYSTVPCTLHILKLGANLLLSKIWLRQVWPHAAVFPFPINFSSQNQVCVCSVCLLRTRRFASAPWYVQYVALIRKIHHRKSEFGSGTYGLGNYSVCMYVCRQAFHVLLIIHASISYDLISLFLLYSTSHVFCFFKCNYKLHQIFYYSLLIHLSATFEYW